VPLILVTGIVACVDRAPAVPDWGNDRNYVRFTFEDPRRPVTSSSSRVYVLG